MNNSENSKRKFAIHAICFVLVFLLLERAVAGVFGEELLVTKRINGMYNNAQNIDLVFFGSSSSDRFYNPEIFNDGFSQNAYNMGGALQKINDSYYLLLEFLKYHTPETVVFELQPNFLRFDESNRMYSEIQFNSLRNSGLKAEYFLNCLTLNHLSGVAFGSKTTVTAPGIVKQMLNAAKSLLGRPYEPDIPPETIDENGFTIIHQGFTGGNIGRLPRPDYYDNDVQEYALTYLEKIAELCESQGIDLILVSSPQAEAGLLSEAELYLETSAVVSDFAETHGLDYYNFNLLKKSVFDKKTEYYYDQIHMNNSGANIFSKVVCDLLKERRAGTLDEQHYLHKDFNELYSSVNTLRNAWFTVSGSGSEKVINCYATGGKNITAEYELRSIDQSGNETILREYSTDPVFSLRLFPGEYVYLRVNARVCGSQEAYEEYYEELIGY